MYSIKQIQISLMTALIMLISRPADAELNYQQKVTLSNMHSREQVEKLTHEFCSAAAGDPNIKVIDIKYEDEKVDSETVWYNAIITCFVSKENEDVYRISGKLMQQNPQD